MLENLRSRKVDKTKLPGRLPCIVLCKLHSIRWRLHQSWGPPANPFDSFNSRGPGPSNHTKSYQVIVVYHFVWLGPLPYVLNHHVRAKETIIAVYISIYNVDDIFLLFHVSMYPNHFPRLFWLYISTISSLCPALQPLARAFCTALTLQGFASQVKVFLGRNCLEKLYGKSGPSVQGPPTILLYLMIWNSNDKFLRCSSIRFPQSKPVFNAYLKTIACHQLSWQTLTNV